MEIGTIVEIIYKVDTTSISNTLQIPSLSQLQGAIDVSPMHRVIISVSTMSFV